MSWDTPEAHSALFCRMENPATKTDRKKTKMETGVSVALWDNLLFCKWLFILNGNISDLWFAQIATAVVTVQQQNLFVLILVLMFIRQLRISGYQ